MSDITPPSSFHPLSLLSSVVRLEGEREGERAMGEGFRREEEEEEEEEEEDGFREGEGEDFGVLKLYLFCSISL